MTDDPRLLPTDLETIEHDDMYVEFNGRHVTIEETGGMAILTCAEARALRDFLNQVLTP